MNQRMEAHLSHILKQIGINFALLALLLPGPGILFAQSDDPQIVRIRQLYQETNARIAQMRQAPSESSTYSVELTVNSGEAQYPAVGTYKDVTRFYYTFGDREKNPYPDRLLKIEVKTNRAARTESAEYLFDSTGELVFCLVKEEIEKRYYFSHGKVLRVLRGENKVDPVDPPARQTARLVQERAKKLVVIFQNSLD